MSQSELRGIMVSAHKGPCEVCKKESNLECMICHLAGFEGAGSSFYCSQEHRQQDTQHKAKCLELCEKRCRMRDVDLFEELCVAQNLLPNQEWSYYESFGFSRCSNTREESLLLALYKGLFFHLEVDRDKVHEAVGNGTLAQLITEVYEVRSPGRRGWYYLWFQENKARLFPGNQ